MREEHNRKDQLDSQSQPDNQVQKQITSSTLVPHLALVGYSNSGKTTLATQIVTLLKQKGYRIGTIKHDAHEIQLDLTGKDTFRYMEAGADIVMIASAAKLTYWEQVENPHSLDQLLQRFDRLGLDLVLIEGFKQEPTPKILVARTEDQLALGAKLSNLLAIATTLDQVEMPPDVTLLNLNDPAAVTLFIEEKFFDKSR